MLQEFKDNLAKFKEKWTPHTWDCGCIMIKEKKIENFFNEIKDLVGIEEEKNGKKRPEKEIKEDILKAALKMDLDSDGQGHVFFNEILYKTMKQRYGDYHIKNKLLAQAEYKAYKKI